MINNGMSEQLLVEKYKFIENQRRELKETWKKLKKDKGDKREIERIGRELTKLTLNQCHIIIDLQWK